jgi:hypothetical protein
MTGVKTDGSSGRPVPGSARMDDLALVDTADENPPHPSQGTLKGDICARNP